MQSAQNFEPRSTRELQQHYHNVRMRLRGPAPIIELKPPSQPDGLSVSASFRAEQAVIAFHSEQAMISAISSMPAPVGSLTQIIIARFGSVIPGDELITEINVITRDSAGNETCLCVPSCELARIISADVCRRHQVSFHDVKSERRTGNLIPPRHELMFLLRYHTGWSLPRIGRWLGGRDHTTVLHACEKHAERRGLDPKAVSYAGGPYVVTT